jgi:hypothetical protein
VYCNSASGISGNTDGVEMVWTAYDLANREMIHWGHITTRVRSIVRYLGSNSAMSKWAIGFLIYTARPRIIAQEL